MSFHNDGQQDRYAGASKNGLSENGDDNTRLVTQANQCQQLLYAGGKWYAYDHAGAGAANVEITQGWYDPTFRVRYISVVANTGTTVRFDLPDTDNVIGSFLASILHAVRMTRIHLDANTTVLSINLYG